jgi:hypothetical protein
MTVLSTRFKAACSALVAGLPGLALGLALGVTGGVFSGRGRTLSSSGGFGMKRINPFFGLETTSQRVRILNRFVSDDYLQSIRRVITQ